MTDRFTWGPGDVTVIDIDADQGNADWLRGRSWDLWTPDGKLIETLDQLRQHFGEDDDALARFMDLPAAKAMPEPLRHAVDGYLFHGAMTKMVVVKSDELERLAALEHAQWVEWSKALAARGDASEATVARWKPMWVPYHELSDDDKEQDRLWARRALQVIAKSDESTGIALAVRERLDEEVTKYSPDQARDEQGRWTDGGTGGGGITSPSGSGRDWQSLIRDTPGLPPETVDGIKGAAASGLAYRLDEKTGKAVDGPDGQPWNEEKIAHFIIGAQVHVNEMRGADGGDSMTDFLKMSPAGQAARLVERQQAVDKIYGDGAKPTDGGRPQAWIVIGPGGSGKSTTIKAQPGLKVVADSDEAKPLLGGYANGIGAEYVHNESKLVNQMVMQRIIKNGDNVAIPVVGHNTARVEQTIDAFAPTHDVHLLLTSVTPQQALERTITRTVQIGRYVPPDYTVTTVDSKPPKVYSDVVTGPYAAKLKSFQALDRSGPFGSQAPEYHPELGEGITAWQKQ